MWSQRFRTCALDLGATLPLYKYVSRFYVAERRGYFLLGISYVKFPRKNVKKIPRLSKLARSPYAAEIWTYAPVFYVM